MDTLPIVTGHTRTMIRISMNDPAAWAIRSVTRRSLMDYEFDPRTRRIVPTRHYTRYLDVKKELYVPVNLTDDVCAGLDSEGFSYEKQIEPDYPTRPLSVQMKPTFVPREHQVPVIEYLSSDQPSRKGLAIQTGSGKTVSSLAGMIAYGKVGMVIVSGLCDQWIRSIKDFTTATDQQIYYIKGFDSLYRLMDSDYKPEIFVISLETLRAYCSGKGHYEDIPAFSKFCAYYGIGCKIMDEVHKNFHACTMIDLSCNIPNNIYLTATFTSGNACTRAIFNRIYPASMRYGEGIRKRYSYVYNYTFYGHVPAHKCMSQRGYSHMRYERYLLRRPSFLKSYFENVLQPVIESHYIHRRQPGEKLAIFFSLLDMVEAVSVWLKSMYKGVKISKYISGVNDDVLATSDIIVTTIKSLGCGSDVKGLITVINTVSFKSPPAVLQLFGRLREIKDRRTEYVDLCDLGVEAQVRHFRDRSALLTPAAVKCTTIRLG